MPLGMEVDLGQGHIVLDGAQFCPPRKGAQQPPLSFWSMSIVAKRSPVSATAELLLALLLSAVFSVFSALRLLVRTQEGHLAYRVAASVVPRGFVLGNPQSTVTEVSTSWRDGKACIIVVIYRVISCLAVLRRK